jgi:glycosyltransferase involved in cell wall biosynthesis
MDLSVVIPLKDEEANLPLLHEALKEVLQASGRSHEILYIDDGSRDQTPRLLKELAGRDSHVKVISFRKSFGQTAALAAGFEHARGQVVIPMDGDLQNDPHDIPPTPSSVL